MPLEEPLDSDKSRSQRDAARAGATAPPQPGKSKDPEQTGLNFIDPEMFLAPGQASTAVPVINAAEQSAKAAEPTIELTLEDPVVDDLLTTPPPPAAVPAPAPAPAAALAAKPESPAGAAAARAAARVPIAKTASLSAAATKLAAASGVARPGTKSSSARSPESGAKSDSAAPKLDAPSLASWASARSAAAQKVRPAPTPAVPAPAASAPSAPRSVAPRSAPAPTPAPAAAAKAAAAAASGPTASATPPPPASAVPAAPTMDRDFIARNQVVERYLSGRLPLKAATEFERFCSNHPELLDEIGLPERVNAGLRLLEASGKPEPWQEAPRPVWQKPQVTLGLALAAIVLLLTLGGVAANSSSKSHRIAELQKQNSERALDPATSTREIRLLPSRSGASNAPAIVIGGGGGATVLADFRIDESRSPYRSFRVTIDRADQGRVAVINNLDKDSNGHLRIALNSSALGPGNYQLTLEGLDWRGQPQPDSWVTIGIQR
ncbi:MAG: hypothetical protein JO158_09520 [Gammaproteobacteria bacterium]|nr:hypothetical protein [Gammaproteobacteria bacterium]MBV9725228.1 hypothetical protein [Gammaproteobacteria bacterium]